MLHHSNFLHNRQLSAAKNQLLETRSGVGSAEPGQAGTRQRQKRLKKALWLIPKLPCTHSSAHLLSKTQRIALAYSFSIAANLTAAPVIGPFRSSTSTFVHTGLQSVSTGPLLFGGTGKSLRGLCKHTRICFQTPPSPTAETGSQGASGLPESEWDPEFREIL